MSNTSTPTPTAATVTIAASPASIAAGTSTMLTVTAANATKVTVTGTDGSSYTLQPNGGTQSVSPTVTTTYAVLAAYAGGTTTATVTVTVVPPGPPTVTMTANPTTIAAGASVTLTVTATNATQVAVTGTDGSSYVLAANGGTQVVSPTVTTTYNATANGTGGGGAAASVIVTVTQPPTTTVTIAANPTSIVSGNTSVLTVTATNATQPVAISGSDGRAYTVPANGGTQSVTPSVTTTYTATATGAAGSVKAAVTVNVSAAGTVLSIDHVIFMLQENHTFDNYFGMLNTYRSTNNMAKGDDGNIYTVDGLDNNISTVSNQDDAGTAYPSFPLKSTCVDDMSSAWLESYGDVNTYDFSSTRHILMDGFVHNAEGYAVSCQSGGGTCSGSFTDTNGQRAMGYYDQGFLNYYYYMASQFALSDRWFSPVSSKSIDNRVATFTGGTTQGLVNDPGNDGLPQLQINNIFEELDKAPTPVSWKVYYTVTRGYCMAGTVCSGGGYANYPATNFSTLSYSYRYLYENPNPSQNPCTGTTKPSSVVGDTSNSFCIDPNHIAPLSTYFTDLTNNTLPSFAFIEAGYANNDEHPGSGQPILLGQAQVANIINKLMASPSWKDSVFFLSYDEGGGPYDHVPPVPGHSNDNTNASMLPIPDISSIAVNPDSYNPCVPSGGTPTLHCDLTTDDPGATSTDAAAQQGFAAQLGFRVPNMVISPFTRRHYVSHIPMDHTAVIKFVESRFIGSSASLTARDAAQPDLLDFFDFNNVPWATPPTTVPTPYTDSGASCTPASM